MSDSRFAEAQQFLSETGYKPDNMRLLAGDASARRYYRIPGSPSVVLMDADPDKGETVTPFITITSYLNEIGLSAPNVLETDPNNGFLIIEDLGDDLFARLLSSGKKDERSLYDTATDVLLHLHRHAPPKLDAYTSEIMAEMSALSVVWYRGGALGTATGADDLRDRIADRLNQLAPPSVLIQRDYHAENLLWLPDREAIRRVGLLDYQDAMLGHPAYDLVSILQDARRDVTAETCQREIKRFQSASGISADEFHQAYHILGLQRNLRILGVFARLCLRDGKPAYIDLIPRVWGHIVHNLDLLQDIELRNCVLEHLPQPDDQILKRLRDNAA